MTQRLVGTQAEADAKWGVGSEAAELFREWHAAVMATSYANWKARRLALGLDRKVPQPGDEASIGQLKIKVLEQIDGYASK